MLPPYLGDKLADWNLLRQAGGQELVIGKDVLELGPSFGVDLFCLAPYAKSYTMIESSPEVLDHLRFVVDRWRALGHDVNLVDANLQHPLAFADATFDLVIDFGTIDNVIAGYAPYREACRVLRPGGMLISTYASRDHFGTAMSDCGDEHRFFAREMRECLRREGMEIVQQYNVDQPRAAIAARKVSG